MATLFALTSQPATQAHREIVVCSPSPGIHSTMCTRSRQRKHTAPSSAYLLLPLKPERRGGTSVTVYTRKRRRLTDKADNAYFLLGFFSHTPGRYHLVTSRFLWSPTNLRSCTPHPSAGVVRRYSITINSQSVEIKRISFVTSVTFF